MQRHKNRIPSLVFGAAIGTAAWLAPGVASAGPNGFDEGGYVHLAPGFGAIELNPCCDGGYGIGAGGGWLWTPGRMFKISFGGAFEHYIDHFDSHGMRFRFLPEVRIGAGNQQVWGYGLIGGSFSLLLDHRRRRDDDVRPGLGPQFGGGVLFAVYRGLYIGGEMDFDIDIYPGPDYVAPTMWFKALVGYNF